MSDKSGTRGDRMLMGRFLAAVDQLAHTGMTEFEAAYDDELGELSPVEVLWRCEGKWQGTRVFSAHFSYPAQAAEDLLGRVCQRWAVHELSQRGCDRPEHRRLLLTDAGRNRH